MKVFFPENTFIMFAVKTGKVVILALFVEMREDVILTNLQLLCDTQTGSHCHMTRILAACPISPRASYVRCQPKHRHLFIYA